MTAKARININLSQMTRDVLGLVSVFEIRGKSWQASDEQISQFLETYEQSNFR